MLERSLEGAQTEEVTLAAVRLDHYLRDEFPEAASAAAWVDVEGNTHSVMQSMTACANRIKLLHVEVETQPIWPGQKLEPEVLSLAEKLGFLVIARGKDGVQRDLILLNRECYAANRTSVDRLLRLARVAGPTASRLAETRVWQSLFVPA